jgi:hypothetical protein
MRRNERISDVRTSVPTTSSEASAADISPLRDRPTEPLGPTNVCVGAGADADQAEDIDMGFGRGLLLWLIGVPIPIILLIALLWHH